MKKTISKYIQNSSVWTFFLLTFTLSWVIWIPMATSSRVVSLSGGDVASLGLLMLGGFSPSLVGIFMTYMNVDKTSRHDLWHRLIDYKRIGLGWYVIILLLFPMIMALTFFIHSLLGGDIPPLKGALQALTQPSELIIFLLTMLIGGPLAEEIGWLGFAQDHMQKFWSALRVSILLGSIRAAWHLPLFFMKGTSQGAMGIGTPLFWLWVVQVIAESVFYTWAYNYNRRSILSAVLIHFMSNTTFTLIAQLGNALPLRIEIIRTIIIVFFAVVMVVICESRVLILKSGSETV